MTEDEPKPKSAKKTWLIVLLAVGIPVLCALVCCGGLGIWGWGMFKDLPAAMINAQMFLSGLSTKDLDPNNPGAFPAEAKGELKELAAKRLEETYQSTSSGFKKTMSLEQFRELVANNPVLTTSTNTQLSGFNMAVENGVKKAVINAMLADSNKSITCTIKLVQENNDWKVDGFTVP